LLFLSAHLPVRNARQAGHKTAYRNLEILAERGPVDAVIFCSEGDRDENLSSLRKLCRRLHVEPVSNRMRFTGGLLNPLAPFMVGARYSCSVAALIRAWSAEGDYSRVHLEWSQMAAYLPHIKSHSEKTLYIHDVMTQWAGRRAAETGSLKWRMELWRARRWEASNYALFDRIFVPSQKDAELVSLINPCLEGHVQVVPLHYDTYPVIYEGTALPEGPLTLLFWGAMARSENADAVRWIVAKLLPRLNQLGVDYRFIAGGSNPPADIRAMASERVIVPGFVEDPSSLFAQAHVGLLPLFMGAGVKVKVLECLASGLPVLTTGIGAEGIEAASADGLFVLEGDSDWFASKLGELDRNRLLLSAASAQARRWSASQSSDIRKLLI
jgi:glycosyltransferase involved in cell wall biosynthesis